MSPQIDEREPPVITRTAARFTFSLLLVFAAMLVLSACFSRATAPSEAEPEPTATAEPEEDRIPGKPVRFQIDRIEVDAEVEQVEQDEEGRMAVPSEWEDVSWYELGPVPGERGNAVIAGHYDSYSGPAVFFELNQLEEGDILRVITEDDEELEFEVYEIELVHIDDADSRKIFGETDEYNLNLVTCEGAWDITTDMYDHRLIVYSRLIED